MNFCTTFEQKNRFDGSVLKIECTVRHKRVKRYCVCIFWSELQKKCIFYEREIVFLLCNQIILSILEKTYEDLSNALPASRQQHLSVHLDGRPAAELSPGQVSVM